MPPVDEAPSDADAGEETSDSEEIRVHGQDPIIPIDALDLSDDAGRDCCDDADAGDLPTAGDDDAGSSR